MQISRLGNAINLFHTKDESDAFDCVSGAKHEESSSMSFEYIWAATLPLQAQPATQCSQASSKNNSRKSSTQKKLYTDKNKRQSH